MKINLVEKTKKLKSSIEIIILSDIEESKDKKVLKTLNFEPKDETSVFLVESNKIYIGCENQDYDSVAIATATAIKKFISTTTKSAKIILSDTLLLNAVVEGALLGSYSFTTYKSDKQKCKKQELNIVVEKVTTELEKVVENSIIISDSVNKVRDMVNTAPADFYPEVMAKKAEEIAVENELECKILGEKYLEKHSMNAMLSVGRASVHESKLIHLSYKPKDAKKKVVLVGKGLTYDSGGLSLKPADYMTTMKSDKSGGCAVLGIINAVSILKLPIEIHAIVGAVENMIGGNAYKPDDVLTARNGKTIEVKNTDAEGRLVLADCLCYAQDEIENIDYIFDYATLTGACVVGVGEYTTGIMGNCEKLKRKAVSNALISGEYATSLDFNRFLRKTLKSEVADINNISSTRYGGAITAGIFLDNFINKENKDKWLHFDIAGPAYVEKAWGYNPFGASGAGVRMTLELLKNL
ncbi:leucyl aminopeptidase [Malaciobacter molluscorum]|uniref:leucyl aminopeptidase n=1 Tax=Malaciobacter molluscorum TaxID=1032072 RepID=UPI00100AF349|nr:leucyl aminopeptidase [Malaciobacter molluscorum]RXJ92890.1 leucyl aminopeptidase [Malaciobacter molluscorum]